jgi:hypothetical protein
MAEAADRFVPKVHPATRAVEPEDPLTLYATPVQGDPDLMLQCMVQEYAWMGWGTGEILELFRNPFYPALNQLWQFYGENVVRKRVAELLRETAVFHIHGTVSEGSEEDEDEEPDLVQLGLPAQWDRKAPAPLSTGPEGPQGSNHGQSV